MRIYCDAMNVGNIIKLNYTEQVFAMDLLGKYKSMPTAMLELE